MKEACDNLRRSNLRREMRDLKSSIFDLAAVRSTATRSTDPSSRISAPKTVCQNSESTNLRPILKTQSRRRPRPLSDAELGLESESPTTTPSSGSVSFSNRRNSKPSGSVETPSKYNSLGGHGRQMFQKRFCPYFNLILFTKSSKKQFEMKPYKITNPTTPTGPSITNPAIPTSPHFPAQTVNSSGTN